MAVNMKMITFWEIASYSLVEQTDVSEMRTVSIIRAMMETVCTPERSVSFETA
jgi:hypothetical protein